MPALTFEQIQALRAIIKRDHVGIRSATVALDAAIAKRQPLIGDDLNLSEVEYWQAILTVLHHDREAR